MQQYIDCILESYSIYFDATLFVCSRWYFLSMIFIYLFIFIFIIIFSLEPSVCVERLMKTPLKKHLTSSEPWMKSADNPLKAAA